MTDPVVQGQLRNIPLFAHLTPPQLGLIAPLAQAHALAAGTLALGEGQPSMGLLAFTSGRGIFTRRRADGVEERIGTIGPGQFVNEDSLFGPRAEAASLRIVEAAAVLFIPRDSFLRLVQATPELRANLRVPAGPPVAAPPPKAEPPSALPSDRPPRAPVAAAAAAVPAQGQPRFTHQPSAPASAALMPGTTAPRRTPGMSLFKGQRADEQILYVFRRHWWAFGRHLWVPIAIAGVGLGAAIAVSGGSALLALVLAGLGLIAAGLIAAYLYADWRDDSIVITDERIVRIWRSVIGLENSLSEIPLDRVLEVTTEVPPGDPFAHIFSYATLYVRTAGEAANMNLNLIAGANNIASLIFAQRDQVRQRVVRKQQDVIQAEIQAALGTAPTVPLTATATAEQAMAQMEQVPLEYADNTGLPFIRTRFLQPGGEIVYRHHGSVWLAHVAAPALIVLGGAVLALISVLAAAPPLPGPIGALVSGAVIAFGLVAFYLADWDWRNDMFILGSDSVTIVRKRPLWLQNQVERMRLSQIDNVTSEVEGLFDNLLNRGEVRIALIGASPGEAKRFTHVYDPESIQAELSRRLSILRSLRQSEDLEQQRKVMLDYLAAYHDLQGTAVPAQVQPGMTFQRPAAPTLPAQGQPTQGQPSQPAAPAPDAVRPPRVPRPRP